MYDIGEKPGVSRYCCTTCGTSVNLDNATDRLPPCPRCGRGQSTKYTRCCGVGGVPHWNTTHVSSHCEAGLYA